MPDTTDVLLSAPTLEEIGEQLTHSAAAITRTTLSLSLATPMFGGGVKAGEIDLSQPFRPSAIRGQLRFWWRATSGARYSTPGELFEAETRLWGDTRHASCVRIHVRNVKPETTDTGWRPGRNRPQREEPTYVHFLISDNDMKEESEGSKPTPQRRLLTGSFDLEIEMIGLEEPQKREVATAIRAWILFGGLGARTRRGCGTLFPAKLTGFDPNQPEASIGKFFGYLPQTPVRPWPTLKGGTLFIGKANPTTDAWTQLIRLYAEFRQQRTPPQAGTNRPGRSYWPEPDAIRSLTGQWSSPHAPLGSDPDEFPRALLGLPVITHFKDERQGDPRDTSLEATNARRHASPLILKIIPVGPNRAVPIALLLNTDIVTRLNGHLELKSGRESWNGLSTGSAGSPLDIRAGRRATRKGTGGQTLTLREWLKTGPLQLKEVTL